MHVICPPHMTLYLHLAAGDVIKSCSMYVDIGVTVKTIFRGTKSQFDVTAGGPERSCGTADFGN